MSAILEAADLTYAWPGGERALDGATLSVPAGRRVAVLGANGAGKSTLLLHLNGTLKPGRGVVRVDGVARRYDRAGLAAWRGRVGLVLQEPDHQLFAPTVAEDVSFGPLNQGLSHPEARERVHATLAALGLDGLADRPVTDLSFGQRKRAALAGIVAMRPAVLVLDEPAAGLDPDGVAHLLAVLDHLVAGGTTVVFATHDADLATAWADDAALFAAGRVLAQGPVPRILDDTALLRDARLHRPWVLDMARTVLGDSIPADALPRDRAGVRALLEERLPQPAASGG